MPLKPPVAAVGDSDQFPVFVLVSMEFVCVQPREKSLLRVNNNLRTASDRSDDDLPLHRTSVVDLPLCFDGCAYQRLLDALTDDSGGRMEASVLIAKD